MQLVSKNGSLVKKSGAIGTADNSVNFCCCGNCPTCPDLCGYYIEARAGTVSYYPLKDGSDERVTENDLFCANGNYLFYPRAGRESCCVATENEGTPALPSACGLGVNDVQYRGFGGVSDGSTVWSSISAQLVVGGGITSEPSAEASLGLSCLNGLWIATVNWAVSRFVGGSLVQCSARRVFPIRTGCSEDATCPNAPQTEGSNIIGKIFTVTGDSVTVSGLGTIPFRDSDRMGNCDNDECMAAWRSLWRAEFEVKRVPCVGGCSGPCDEANPCPEGCCCIDGQCVTPEEGQCCGPCDEANPCSEGCVCCEGECVPENEIPEGSCCGPCDETSPCPEGCSCVNGRCEILCREFQEWDLEVNFCGKTFTLNKGGAGNFGGYQLGADAGACCSFGLGNPCPGGQFTGPGTGFFGVTRRYYICLGADFGTAGYQCDSNASVLSLSPQDATPESPCVGSVKILATAPTDDCNFLACTVFYTADIIDGELANQVTVVSSHGCECGGNESMSVTLNYNPLP